MKSLLIRSALFSCGLALLCASCGGGGDDSGNAASQLCKKLDECNSLDTGVSANECSENLAKALKDMSASQRNDCENQIDICLQKSSCSNFLSCDIGDCTR